MSSGRGESELPHSWEKLYKDALFEADIYNMPRRIEIAKHAILDRLEDVTCAKKQQAFETGELLSLRAAHRTLRVLEHLYVPEDAGKLAA
jgi:hypothetical protein